MKTLIQMTKKTAAFAFIAASTLALGQSVVYTFDNNGSSTAGPSTVAANISASNVTRINDKVGIGLLDSGSPSNGYANASGGYAVAATAKPGALDVNNSTYYQFTVSAAAGYELDITNIAFGTRARQSGPTNFSIRTSKDNYSSELAGMPRPGTDWGWVTTPVAVAGNSITFRIYGYGNTGAGSSVADWRVDDLQIVATVRQASAGVVSIKSGEWTDKDIWSTGSVPVAGNDVTIASGTTVNIPTGIIQNGTLTINGTLQFSAAATFNGNVMNNGNLVVASGAGFVQGQNSSYSGTGSVNIYRNANVHHDEYNFWSSPIKDFDMSKLYRNGTTPQYILAYNTSNDYFVVTSSTGVPAKGFAIKGSPNATVDASQSSALFTGNSLNNGIIISQQLKMGGAFNTNLIGNPYPSNLSLVDFYNGNDANISPTIMLWDNTNTHAQTQQGSSYNGDNYAVYNAYSGIGSKANNGTVVPTRYVSLGQGFLVEALNEGAVSFSNNMRDAANTGLFYSRNLQKNDAVARVVSDRYTLKFTTPAGETAFTTIGYDTNASNGYGLDDSQVVNPNNPNMIFTYADNDTHLLVIQVRKAPFVNSDSFAVGTHQADAGMSTISLDAGSPITGVFASGQAIYLYDKVTGTYTDLTKGNYSYNAAVGNVTDRFKIVYIPSSLSTIDASAQSDVVVYKAGEDFVVDSKNKISSLEIFDMSGKQVYTAKPNANKHNIRTSGLAKGIYLVRINNGALIVKKISK